MKIDQKTFNKKNPAPYFFAGKFHLFKLFQKKKKERKKIRGHLQTFYEAWIILIPKPKA